MKDEGETGPQITSSEARCLEGDMWSTNRLERSDLLKLREGEQIYAPHPKFHYRISVYQV